VIIGKQYTIHSAHYLPGHSDCGRMHGHTYKIDVRVSGPMGPMQTLAGSMVIDFKALDKLVLPTLRQYDHKCLNDYMKFPTCEVFAAELAREIVRDIGVFESEICLESVQVWETDNAYALWRR